MSIVIIYGPQGCGKTRYSKEFMQHFEAKRLVDNWDGRKPLSAGDLALTNEPPPYPIRGARVFDAKSAKSMATRHA